MTPSAPASVRSRAQGCLLGQIAGDSLGSLVEFEDASTIRELYPDGVRELADGGTWNTLAGQPTDDSEMALALARSLVTKGEFSLEHIRAAYVRWNESGPFDIGHTTRCGLTGRPVTESQANGALMRISPLGVFGWKTEPEALAKLAAADAALTHPHGVCRQVNGLYAAAIAAAVREGCTPRTLFEQIAAWAIEWNVDPAITDRIDLARTHRPPDYIHQMGWVLTAFQNALYELLHAPTLEEGVIATVHCGGDTDTNAAICGALLGAVHGRQAVPRQWVEKIVACRPATGNAPRARPREYWPHDALVLAEQLVRTGMAAGAS